MPRFFLVFKILLNNLHMLIFYINNVVSPIGPIYNQRKGNHLVLLLLLGAFALARYFQSKAFLNFDFIFQSKGNRNIIFIALEHYQLQAALGERVWPNSFWLHSSIAMYAIINGKSNQKRVLQKESIGGYRQPQVEALPKVGKISKAAIPQASIGPICTQLRP